MNEYHKIQTIYKRDPATNHKTLLDGEYSTPEFEYLADLEWEFTEKVDGTNIRVMFSRTEDGAEYIKFRGRTDGAQIPVNLLDHLRDEFTVYVLGDTFEWPVDVCLYGEGFGAGIQKGGGLYRNYQDFVLFDVKVGNFWLERENVEDIASKLGIECVPVIGRGSLRDCVEIARDGFRSHWGDFVAEGIVARPKRDLLDRAGNRVIAKVKHKDFL